MDGVIETVTQPITDPQTFGGGEVLCPECDFDLHASAGDRCPSCGWEINYQVLLARTASRSTARRLALALTAFVVGAGALFALASLATRGRPLTLSDGFIVLSVALASAGHLSLAALALARRNRWPMRLGAAADLLLFAAIMSILLGVAGAAQFYSGLPPRRVVRGVEVTGVLEFAVAAMLLLMPGCMLLILRLVSFADGRVATTEVKERAGSSLPVRATFCVGLLGSFRPEQVRTFWSDVPRRTTETLEKRIEQAWQEQVRKAAAENRRLYNGDLIRLISVKVRGGRLELELGPTTFREFVGTLLFNENITEGGVADALGVSAVVLCRDHVLVFGRRGEKVAFHAGHLHTFGGLVERSDLRADQSCDVFEVCLRELHEEAGVLRDEVREIQLMALIEDRDLRQPELIFGVQLHIDSKELLRRFRADDADQEHSGLEFLFEDPDAVLPFLRRATPVAPIAEAALLLHGRNVFGTDWYEQTCYVLYGEMPPAGTPWGR